MRAYCPACGAGADVEPGAHVTCPRCGVGFEAPRPEELVQPWAPPPPPPPLPPPPRPSESEPPNTLAVISLVSSLMCCMPLIAPLTAVVTGVLALRQLDARRTTPQRGRGLALFGLVVGAVVLLVQVLARLGR